MQADAERRQPARAGHGIGDRRAGDHQARRREDATTMRDLDRLVDLDGDARSRRR